MLVEDLFKDHRDRLLNVAYRLLGSVSEAEDAVQEAHTRLLVADLEAIDDPEAWLVTVTSRLCLDRLRSHDVSRRAYVGPWLPEPLLTMSDDQAGPEQRITLDESVRMALLVVLERLTPAERTAFVLHDVFQLPFAEIGEIVGRSPQACRKLASRARRAVADDRRTLRQPIDREEHEAVVERFISACRAGNLDALIDILADDVIGDFDSGGALPGAPLHELEGSRVVAQQLLSTVAGRGAGIEAADVNDAPGVVIRFGSRTVAVIAVGVHRGVVDWIHGIGNPDKLRHLV